MSLINKILLELGNFSHLTTKQVLEQKPTSWKIQTASNGKGWKLVDENYTERIRFMLPTKRYPNGYWVIKNQYNQFLDANGKVVSEDQSKDEQRRKLHIPYSGGEDVVLEFKKFQDRKRKLK